MLKQQKVNESEVGEEPSQQHNSLFMAQLVSISAIGGFLFGYDTGVISGAQLYFILDFPHITDTQRSLIVSLALAGAAVGSLFSGTASDRWGRKKLIMFADILFTIGAIIMAFAPTIGVLMLGRVFVGLGVGVAAQIVPLYLSEVAPIEIRGKVIAINNAMITVA
jgi:SP family myo-inositol transporter-like MFS transporter 13